MSTVPLAVVVALPVGGVVLFPGVAVLPVVAAVVVVVVVVGGAMYD